MLLVYMSNYKMNKNILYSRKATVFVGFYELVNYVFMIFCFGRVLVVAWKDWTRMASHFLPFNLGIQLQYI